MHRFFLGLSRAMAIAGGFVLSLLVAIIVVSIVGREVNSLLHGAFFQDNMAGFADWLLAVRVPGIWGDIKVGPINGDYEIIEAGMAFTIFAFLPLAQITGAHASVDIFTSWLPEGANRVLTLVIDVVFGVVMVIIAIQLWHGTLSKFERIQTTFLLQFPIWWAYALSLVGAVMAAIVATYLAIARVVGAVTGRDVVHYGEGAEH